ncbi:TspO/MBR family protein [Micromonospora sp. NPDC049559]|uniref:TspO/MBR family protein n=1 Tax=Micromonospora sp. NPDC049559 TaxID=3155923 RepID=UPI003415BCC7
MSTASLPLPRRRGRRSLRALLGFGAATFAAAAIGAFAVRGTATEYDTLVRPSWAPPSWLFGPVWTVLYVSIAVAGWLAWQRAGWGPALWSYAAQLVLNAAWTPIFFGLGRYGLALVDIVALWLLVAATIVLFHRVSRPAAGLLAPYLAWVSFATALNAAIVTLN